MLTLRNADDRQPPAGFFAHTIGSSVTLWPGDNDSMIEPPEEDRLSAISQAAYLVETMLEAFLVRLHQPPQTEDIPEVFTLEPLSRRRVKVRVRHRRPASFYFVDSDHELAAAE